MRTLKMIGLLFLASSAHALVFVAQGDNVTFSSITATSPSGVRVSYGLSAGSVTARNLANTVVAADANGVLISTTVTGGGAGTISNIIASSGITGGGSSGAVTLSVSSVSLSTQVVGTLNSSHLDASSVTLQGNSLLISNMLTQSSATATYAQISSITATYLQTSSATATYANKSVFATTTASGTLTATDWNTFNNKGSGSGTSSGTVISGAQGLVPRYGVTGSSNVLAPATNLSNDGSTVTVSGAGGLVVGSTVTTGALFLTGSGPGTITEPNGSTYVIGVATRTPMTVGNLMVIADTNGAFGDSGVTPGGNVNTTTAGQVAFYSAPSVITSSSNFTNNGTTITMSGLTTMTESGLTSRNYSGVSFDNTGSTMTVSSMSVNGPFNAQTVKTSSDVYFSSGSAAGFDEYQNGAYVATSTITWQNGNKQAVTLTANTVFSFNAPDNSANLSLRVATGAGSFTATWPGTVLWPAGTAPTITATASKVDLIACYYSKVATKYYCVATQNF